MTFKPAPERIPVGGLEGWVCTGDHCTMPEIIANPSPPLAGGVAHGKHKDRQIDDSLGSASKHNGGAEPCASS
jgi:hypothetical protein